MFKKVFALTTAAMFLAGAAFAGAPGKDKGKKKPAPKLTEVTVCPMTGHAATKAGGSEVVGKYKVEFCCGMCKPDFDKLSKKDKEKKIADALKKAKKS